ncbi:drug/metabolite transporter (DMT)-like permease [Rhizobium leguminosarum]|uniref:Drug/metabolite transporter (DMT)-like permease n=1 Tax=Rhizobium leguminosarum TaxID=384 RepID=A0AAE2SYZ0_RHILE|nr:MULTISPECIES: DMT family transporter [Rhizobium]MBB4292019.1 drug/metabolite transporter (DMT)-like permease [Rhizobium leguminosarum]MBB4310043.1 drug/metabolite transporter (DMT)-like permease [Rhizobium leguminosarum]MBB4419216.1 drug/metabolite transporter (DMT)-like permease [Rhizobium leguminosarum]MBB4434019.1 drug/metabolite transporter (DMT)-like permease [Rhizobium esperanzae]MBB4531201.1 drug/metabolite transporter (DMT)-like permease [Rhizobium leguminosarum]
MAIHVLAVHRDTVGTEQAAGGSLTAAYSVGVFCWLLSAGVYIAAKWVSSEMPPWALCFWRVLIAWAILMPIVYRHFGAMVALVRARGLELLAIGGVGLGVCQGLIFVGLEHADATTAGIIIALIPIITMILARFILAEPMGRWQVIGSILAFLGIVVIIVKGSPAALLRLDLNPGELWIVAGAFCFSLYTVLLRRAKFDLNRLALLVLLLGAAVLTALPFYLSELVSDERSTLNASGLIALGYVAIPGGAVMYYLFNRSIEALGAARAGVLLYIQTIFIAMLAYLFLGEQLQRYHLEGAALIVAGLLLIILLKPTTRAEATKA